MAMDDLSLVEDIYPILIIAPKRVARDTWPSETKKWAEFNHITISAIIGTPKERQTALKRKVMVYTTNNENIEWLIAYHGDKWPYKVIVFDESSRLRGYRTRQGTKRAQALMSVAFKNNCRFIELTGTPNPNGLINLWGQLAFLDKGERLGKSFASFEQRWFRRGFDGFSLDALPHAQKEIESKIKDLCISIDLKDYMDIKKPVESNIEVNLPEGARKLYKDMEKQFFMELDGHPIEAFNAAAKSGKLSQICNGAAYVNIDSREWKEIHTAKIEALESLIEESNGMPIMVSYNFVSDRERLLKHFGKDAVDLATEKGFKDFLTGKFSIGIAHPASMAHGVDGLQYVTNIIAHFGIGWDLELYDQINGRVGPTRQLQAGFDRPAFVYHIIAKNTIDELVLERLTSKRKVQDILLEALKARKVN
jgi:SNF2 family DNA or RNA helicase